MRDGVSLSNRDMPKPKQIVFRADPQVADWYESLENGARSRILNQVLLAYLEQDTPGTISERLTRLETRYKELEASIKRPSKK